MKRYLYYPGCSLKRYGTPFETSTLACAEALGIDMPEMDEWNCCGTVHGLARDRLIYKVAPLRNLLRARNQGAEGIVTLCSICYNTLKRTNEVIREDEETRRRLNAFLEDEDDYAGDLPVVHLLEILRDDVGFDAVAAAVTTPLKGLKVSPYYGCMLVRPESLGLDDMERPELLTRLFKALGAEVVESPFATECCGSYHAVSEADTASEYAARVIDAAASRGAAVLAASCPLCVYNLDARQADARATRPSLPDLPVLYFTQLMGLALGADPAKLGFGEMAVDPAPALAATGLPVGETAAAAS